MNRILIHDLWPRLRQLARKPRRRAVVAVPFIGNNAAEQVPLRKGDVLITMFGKAAVQHGVVDPRAVVTFIRRGVEVHTVANLHAKVYVFGRVAIVGSANMSKYSENNLIEVGCEITETALVRQCRDFVNSLRGDVVELDFAKAMIPHYRPPIIPFAGPTARSPRRATKQRIKQSDLVAVPMRTIDYDDVDERIARATEEKARIQLKDESAFRLENFRWTGSLPSSLRKYARVLMCTTYGRQTRISPPARVLQIRRYKSRRGAVRAMIVVEVRRRLRDRILRDVLQHLGSEGKSLRGLRRVKPLPGSVSYKLGQLWPAVQG